MYLVQQRDDASIIEVRGELNAFSSQALASAIALAESTLERPVVVSLLGCPHSDSAGLRILVSAKNRLKERLLVIVPAGSRLSRVFKTTGLAKFLSVSTSLEEALGRSSAVILNDFRPRRRRRSFDSVNDTFGPPPRRRRKDAADPKPLSHPQPYADIIPMMQTLAANGVSLREIAAKLDGGGHKTFHGDPWCAIQVSRVLSRS